MKLKKGYTDEKMEEMFQSGELLKILKEPRGRKKKVYLYDKRTGWERWVSRRVGAIGIKLGMRRECDIWGHVIPVTLLQLQDNVVVQVKNYKDHQLAEDSEYVTLQVGAGLARWKNLRRAEMGHFAHKNLDPKQHLAEFRVSPNAVLPVGTPINANHFVCGQFVDVQGVTKGKGFQGVMKRFGYHGFPASHGHSRSHRSGGAINVGCQTPGKVLPNTKMPGRMGGVKVTTWNLQIIKINVEDGILAVSGCVPGPKGAVIKIRDAVKKPHRIPPPYPTNTFANKGIKYKRLRYKDPYATSRFFDWEHRWREASIALKSAQQSAGGLLEGEEEDGDDEFEFK